MPREDAASKARRLLGEGRLTVLAVNPDARAAVVAKCRGDSGLVYDLGYDALKGEYRCGCEAKTDQCSHLRALRLVTLRPEAA